MYNKVKEKIYWECRDLLTSCEVKKNVSKYLFLCITKYVHISM